MAGWSFHGYWAQGSATLLPDGRLLVVGALGGSWPASSDLFDASLGHQATAHTSAGRACGGLRATQRSVEQVRAGGPTVTERAYDEQPAIRQERGRALRPIAMEAAASHCLLVGSKNSTDDGPSSSGQCRPPPRSAHWALPSRYAPEDGFMGCTGSQPIACESS